MFPALLVLYYSPIKVRIFIRTLMSAAKRQAAAYSAGSGRYIPDTQGGNQLICVCILIDFKQDIHRRLCRQNVGACKIISENPL